jgi:hypothetical protein
VGIGVVAYNIVEKVAKRLTSTEENMKIFFAMAVIMGMPIGVYASGWSEVTQFSDQFSNLAVQVIDLNASANDVNWSGFTLPSPVAAHLTVPDPARTNDCVSFSGEPGSGLNFLEVKPFRDETNPKWSPIMQDVMDHRPPDFNYSFDNMSTDAHETIHAINQSICWHNNNTTCAKSSGFYLGDSRGVLLPNPKIKKSQIEQFIPASLRGFRYKTYMIELTWSEEYPLYILNEWVAYTYGTAAGIDLANHGLWTNGKRDQSGPIEFLAYSLATAMALKVNEPDYCRDNPQFREFLGFMTKRTMEAYTPVAQFPEFSWSKKDDLIYNNLKSSADAEPLRAYARELFGAEWTNTILGF